MDRYQYAIGAALLAKRARNIKPKKIKAERRRARFIRERTLAEIDRLMAAMEAEAEVSNESEAS